MSNKLAEIKQTTMKMQGHDDTVILDVENYEYLLDRAEKLSRISSVWIGIEEHGTKEDAEDFYSVVQDILTGESDE